MATFDESIIHRITLHKEELKKKFSVESVAVFGSVGKGMARKSVSTLPGIAVMKHQGRLASLHSVMESAFCD